jgi:hypothetical protein
MRTDVFLSRVGGLLVQQIHFCDPVGRAQRRGRDQQAPVSSLPAQQFLHTRRTPRALFCLLTRGDC